MASSLSGAYAESQALKTQGKYEQAQAETNARLSDMQAEDAIRRGDKDAKNYGAKVKQTIGAQRARMAAQGIEIDDGSALDIQGDTAAIGAEDVMTIKNNAWREAWGFRAQSNQFRTEGRFANHRARTMAKQTLITGGIQATMYAAKGIESAATGGMGGGGPAPSMGGAPSSSYNSGGRRMA